MSKPELATPTTKGNRDRIVVLLTDLFAQLFNVKSADLDVHTPLLEMGADSLFLLQTSHAIQSKFGVKVPFRMMLEEFATVDALASFLEEKLSLVQPSIPKAPVEAAPSQPLPQSQGQAIKQCEVIVEAPSPKREAQPTTPAPPQESPNMPVSAGERLMPTNAIERVLSQQLEVMSGIMSQQLGLLQNGRLQEDAEDVWALAPPLLRTEQNQSEAQPVGQARTEPAMTAEPAGMNSATRQAQANPDKDSESEPFVPFEPIKKGPTGGLTDRHRRHISGLIERVCRRTKESKRLAQLYRPVLADNRATAGFLHLWKEMQYPLIIQRGSGAKVWDVDGNEYVDLTMGFGALLFGHSPRFLIDAVQEQLSRGLQLGGESHLTGRVAELFCELTGVERVTFCNSGTEAVMTSLRLARAVTGREKIALFEGSYHGTFDGVMVRGERNEDGSLRPVPLAPGIPLQMVNDVLLLRYNYSESLDILKAHMHELAAVLIEPPRSRRPDVRPQAFLQEVRQMTAEAGVALIFDEVVTGFRFNPGGAQAMFGIKADIVTYGKALGSGIPVAAVGGKAKFMDAIDGGMWSYGDSSYPQADTTYFAGTYFKHPLTMAAVWAVLNEVKRRGESLQEELAERTDRVVKQLEDFIESERYPIKVMHYGSLFRFQFARDLKFMDLFFYHLLEKGVYVSETRSCFLSTAHTEEDTARVLRAVKEALIEMREGGFFPSGPSSSPDGKGGMRRDTNGHTHVAQASVRLPAGSQAITDASVEGATALVKTFPLTAAQKQLWFLAQMGQDASASYNQSMALRMSGPLSMSAIRRAIQTVVDRHEAVRATFNPDGDYQLIRPRMDVDVALVDFSHLGEAEKGLRLEQWLLKQSDKPFDFVKGPLIRFAVARLEERLHILIITAHHIITDGVSFGVLLGELSKIYSAEAQGVTCHLPESTPFSQYARWQLEQQDVKEETDQAYWLERFSDSIPVLNLPMDHARPPIQTYSGSRFESTISETLYGSLKAVAAQCGCTLFMTLLAGFKVLLHKLTNQNSLVVGTPSAGQTSMGSLGVVGYCVNILPLRTEIDGAKSFKHYAADLRGALLDACDHQDYSFSTLVKRLNPPRSAGLQPLFTAAFNLDQVKQVPTFSGLKVDLLQTPTHLTQFDIGLNITDTGGDLLLNWYYNTDLLEFETIKRWDGYFENLFRAIAREPGQRISDLSLLSEADRYQLLVEWNDTSKEFLSESCIHELFEKQVRETPQNIAVEFDGERVTYKELNARANRLARYLRSQGVGAEQLVGVCLDSSIEMVVALIALIKAGGAYLPLDPAYPKQRLDYILSDANLGVVLTKESLAGLIGNGISISCLDSEDAIISEYSDENLANHLLPYNLVYVIYTSGSTGKPKGVMVQHRGLCNLVEVQKQIFDIDASSRVLQFASPSFDAAISEIFVTLSAGGTICLASKESLLPGPYLTDLLRRQAITTVTLPPSVLAVLPAENLPALRTVISAGEACSMQIVEQWAGEHTLVNGYGPTEATIGAAMGRCSKNRKVTIGRAMPNAQLYILDWRLQPVPVGVPGELFIAGVGLARGYLNEPGMTAEKFLPDPFSKQAGARMYKTGDLCRYEEGGEIEYLGRVDEQVKLRGYRIELGEVEAALNEHEGVTGSVVVMREDQPGHKRLVAYVVERNKSASGSVYGEQTNTLVGQSELWPSVAEYFIYDDVLYYAMTSDEGRNRAYRTAISRTVRDKIVVDIGTGPEAHLARMCIDAGAEKVYSIEIIEKVCKEARLFVKRLGLEDRIIILQGDSTKIELPEKADVCVSGIVGSISGSEGAVPILNNAKRFLNPGGVMIPAQSTTMIAAVSLPDEFATNPGFTDRTRRYVEAIFDEVGYMFDLRLCLKGLTKSDLISGADVFEELDFREYISPIYRREVSLTITKDSRIDGFLLWLNLQTIEGERIDILEREHCWLPIFLPVFWPGVEVSNGDSIKATITGHPSDNDLNPDYKIKGTLIRKHRTNIDFDYNSYHHGKSFNKNPLYESLFAGGRIKVKEEKGKLQSSELSSHLRKFLPEYMIPTGYVIMDELPLTPNGKLDKKALPPPDADRSFSQAIYQPPVTLSEQILARIWSEVLGVKLVGLHDNFFDLGGDSILSIQIVARALRAGLQLAPRQLFQHQTITELAEAAGRAAAPVGQQGLVVGPVPLTPIQEWFFQQQLVNPHHWNQAMMMEVDQNVAADKLGRAIAQLPLQHDALRMRFSQGEQGWQQYCDADQRKDVFMIVDLRQVAGDRQEEVIERESGRVQASLNIEAGAMMRAVMYETGSRRKLLMVVHHLVVDVVSWGILTEDIRRGYEQLSRGEEIELGAKSTSYKEWAERLAEYAGGEEIGREVGYWEQRSKGGRGRLPVDKPGGRNEERGVSHEEVEMSEEETEKLMKEVSKESRAKMNEVILAGVVEAVMRWSGGREVVIDVEGHGREEVMEGVDVSRTVGWFTAIARMVVEGGEGGVRERLRKVKEEVRGMKGGGIGYGLIRYKRGDKEVEARMKRGAEAEIIFNYVGLANQTAMTASLFHPVRAKIGPVHSPAAQRKYLIELNGGVRQGRLRFVISYCENIHLRISIERLKQHFIEALREMIAYCSSPDDSAYTPSDFAAADLSQEELDELMSELHDSSR